MGRGVFVYGAGGHGKVVAEALLLSGSAVLGFLDDAPARHGQTHLGLPVFGGLGWLRERFPGAAVALAAGDNRVRARWFEACCEAKVELVTVIHPRAEVSRYASVGLGTVVLPLAVVNAAASVGRAAIVNSGAIVEHDAFVGDFAHVASRAVLQGGVKVGVGAVVGAGATLPYGSILADFEEVASGACFLPGMPPTR